MNRLIFFGLVLVAIVAAGAVYSLSTGMPVQAVVAQRGRIQEFVDERGKTRLPKTHLITMPFGGRIEAIEPQEGACVKEGQVVARISPQDLEDAVAEAKAAVDRLEASIVENDDTSVESTTRRQAELFVESMDSTVAAAESKLRADKSHVEYSETFLGRVARLAQSGGVTEDELDRARLSHIESEVIYRQDALQLQALKAMKSASDLLPRIAAEYISRKSLTHDVLEKQKQEAEARLRQALLRESRGEMKSPIDGIILDRVVSNEQYLSAGEVVLRIGQLDTLEIETDVLSEDVVRVNKGDAAEIYGPAIGAELGQGDAGIVDRIYPAGFTKISSLGVEQQRVTVIVRFAPNVLERLRETRTLGVDYRVRVRIFTDQRTDTLVIPRSAVFRGADGGWATYAVRKGRVRLTPIETGLMNDEAVEVTSGIAEGDVIVLAPESSLEHGHRVNPIVRVPATDKNRG